ncbi:amino acid/amide ABC transporter ATP-binding protein 2, HAAT family (TC 3.A.1.4.-) [Proteiniborus ethanoligenes]|uniref:Amino acid/amide ABC transporter ATP-binding protein 2, HAAT family (TC 3.A.1.4.-) n=1 Tax=Proteiniborus ethanoligenes TaxID=415015 RepID=A0A1H3NT57_9FIRM|nr:ABC transporter ATP-binding protein [Proteiniborus ethanoligenes]SDY91943.1 amino acid/amide ABC transporter ATP-binding protein 2, HAAT family (TC 3.A.1.4.-) [Proteiniborus ethanoligenes]
MTSILKTEDLVSYIGLYTILQGVNVEVNKGEAIAILGRNGAGKTTFLKTIMGLVNTRSGSIMLDGESIVGVPTYHIAKKGIGYVPEDYGVFDELTIEENLKIAMWKEDKVTLDRLARVLDLFPDLKIAYKRLAKTLSGGQRQMLSISRALLNDNKIILIDEPSKGLAPVVIERLGLALREISKESTILLVEQNFALACAVASRYYIIDEGRTVHDGTIKDLIKDTELQAKHLGI